MSNSGLDDDIATEKTFTKGPWTQEEDNLLIGYVAKHGAANWNAVYRLSGLSRNANSCRVRWSHYLRPDLKKGPFTEEEKKRVIQLYALWGKQWARIARELPGRTDFKVKNFCGTSGPRMRERDLPVYTDAVRNQEMNREQAMIAATPSGLHTDSLDAHHGQDSFEADKGRQRTCFFQPNMIASPYMSTSKRSRESETAFPCTGGYAMNEENPLLWDYPFLDDLPDLLLQDSHLFGKATSSFSPGRLIHEVELPSFQDDYFHEEPGSLGAQQSNPMPEHEPENTLVQFPVTTDHKPSSSLSDGLLDPIVYGSSLEKRANDTDSESPLFQSSVQGERVNGSLEVGDYKQPLVWIALEMTGLNVEVDRIMEIACIITDGNFTKSVEGPDLVVRQTKECLDNMGVWCQTHHGASGLTKKVLLSTTSERQAEQEVIGFITKHCGSENPLLAGNSVYLDFLFLKKYMPDLAALFPHILVDVGSIKALGFRWFPKEIMRAPAKKNNDGAMDDIRESIKELKYYKETIFKA